jgi:hypothetical protein
VKKKLSVEGNNRNQQTLPKVYKIENYVKRK